VLDRGFWEGYRRRLEREFEQDEILIRVMESRKSSDQPGGESRQ